MQDHNIFTETGILSLGTKDYEVISDLEERVKKVNRDRERKGHVKITHRPVLNLHQKLRTRSSAHSQRVTQPPA